MISLPEFVRFLLKTLRDHQMYGPRHMHFLKSLAQLHDGYGKYLGNRSRAQIASRNGRIFVDKVAEDRQNLQIKALAGLLEDRQIHAILFGAGATEPELQELCAMLSLTPVQLHEAGGPRRFLEERGVTHIQVLATRLEEVTEAGEVLASLLETMAPLPGAAAAGQAAAAAAGTSAGGGSGLGLGGRGGPAAAGPEPGASEALESLSRLRGYLLSVAGSGAVSADLAGLGTFLQDTGLDREGAQAGTQGLLAQAISGLDAEQRLSLLMGGATASAEPMRKFFGRLIGSQGAESLVELYRRGAMNAEDLAEAAGELHRLSPNPSQWASTLIEALRKEGLSEAQLQELMEVLGWESLSMEEKLARLLEGQKIFEMPVAKVLAFLRELLEAGRTREFLQLLSHFATGLAFPNVARRGRVASAFEAIADWVDIPGLDPPLIQALMDILARAYGREKDPEVHRSFSQAVEHLLWFWVEQGSPQRAEAMFADLQDTVTELSLPAPWKAQATEALLARLGTPERLDKVLKQLFYLDREAAAVQVHPYLRMLGPAAAAQLVERLEAEKDRVRRGRLLEALKSCGSLAEAPLLESLKSPEWFVVRNALVVLGEVASAERLPEILGALKHRDPRVVRAAVRAAGRVGGRQAEAPLVALLPATEPATQLEVLFALGELKAKGAVNAVAELARLKGKLKPGQDKVRDKAIETLGTLGSASAIPVLEALLARRKGFFSESKEPAEVRIPAFRALLALGLPEGRQAAERLLEQEPAGPEQEAFQAALYPA